jgi:2-polyprenyl-3-methyl-5-hydroxy-6-metoxy-1,4-benzoquinol methylase
MDTKEILEGVYKSPGAIWTFEKPPPELAEVIESGKVKPCKALDVGCGEGFYSVYLASKGFDVTGIDISERAIHYARENAAKSGVKVRFLAMDMLDIGKLGEKFDFILEWSILHFLPHEHREKYVETVSELMNKGGKYLSTCFNEQSTMFGSGRVREATREGAPTMTLYFSTQDELRKLFERHFRVIETKLMHTEYREGRTHTWNFFLLEKK